LHVDRSGRGRRQQLFFDLSQGLLLTSRFNLHRSMEGLVLSAVGLKIWINDLDARLGWENKHRSYRLLRTVLQTLRDWLPAHEAANFGAQFPELLRGVYYEHWRPTATPMKQRHRADFLARVDDSFQADPLLFTADSVMAVFELLSEKIAAGEAEKARHALPADLRALWPVPSQAAWAATAEER
jgi:uncharacterized protein (DUF2267 family)